jgi:hypothetical protein
MPDEHLAKLLQQVSEGSVNPQDALLEIQKAREEEEEPQPSALPKGLSPDEQIATMNEFLEEFARYDLSPYVFGRKPISPMPYFEPESDSEVMILGCYLPDATGEVDIQRTIDSWWKFITMRQAAAGVVVEDLKFSTESFYLSEHPLVRRLRVPGIHWIRYDFRPQVAFGLEELKIGSMGDLWKDDSLPEMLAGPETLMAFAHRPELIADKSVYLASYQLQQGMDSKWPSALMFEQLTALEPKRIRLRPISAYGPGLRAMPPIAEVYTYGR